MSKLLQFDAMILLKMINKGFIHKDLSRICKFEMQLILKLTSFLKLLFYPKKTHFHYHKLAQPTIIAQIMKKYIFSFNNSILTNAVSKLLIFSKILFPSVFNKKLEQRTGIKNLKIDLDTNI